MMAVISFRRKHVQTVKLLGRIAWALLKRCWIQVCVVLIIISLIWYAFGFWAAFFTLLIILIDILYESSDWFLYHPNDPSDSRSNLTLPSVLKLPYESHFIKTQDGVTIHIWLIKYQSPSSVKSEPKPSSADNHNTNRVPTTSDSQATSDPQTAFMSDTTLVYLHGNAGNIGHRLQNVADLYHKVKCNILMVEYRGYGLSSGRPSEKGLYLDAEAAIKWLQDVLTSSSHSNSSQNHKIILYGRSLGAGVAINLASKPYIASHLSGVIVENTFTSIPDIGRILFNFRPVHWIPRWLYKNKYNSYAAVGHITIPMLFLSGLSDELIPPVMMYTLYHKAENCSYKEFHTFERGTHNFTWMCRSYYDVIKNFLTRLDTVSQNSNSVPSSSSTTSYQACDDDERTTMNDVPSSHRTSLEVNHARTPDSAKVGLSNFRILRASISSAQSTSVMSTSASASTLSSLVLNPLENEANEINIDIEPEQQGSNKTKRASSSSGENSATRQDENGQINPIFNTESGSQSYDNDTLDLKFIQLAEDLRNCADSSDHNLKPRV